MAKFFTPSKLSENIRETPEGFLLCLSVPVARTGWQEYGPGETPLEVGADGKVWVHRDPEEVFRPQTIASFLGKSITIRHPNDFVDPKNWRLLSHGSAQNVRKGEEKDDEGEYSLIADLLITDEIAIGLVKNGLREVSCGYDAEYEQTGEGEGRQYNIIGNHIALVEQGRAGPTYAIKDHKGKANSMDFKGLMEQIKNLGKTVDEAAAAQKERADKLAAKKVKDATPEQVTYDDLVKCVKDLSEKINGAAKSDDEEMEEKSKDAEMEMGARLEKLEMAVSKILEALGNEGAEDEEKEEKEDGKEKSKDADKEEEEEEEEKSKDEKEDKDMSGDEDMEESEDEKEESEDEEGEEGEESQKKKTGDAARFEILTPGEHFTGVNARMKCLKVFAKTEDGAKVLKQLGMTKPVFDAKSNVDMIFMAASAIVKSKRGVGLQGTKDGSKWEDAGSSQSEPMTAERMNEINAKHYGVAK